MAMAHPDSETRIGAHSVFSVVLMPSLFSSWLDQKTNVIQKLETENFAIQDKNSVGTEPMKSDLSKGKTIAGINGKYAAHPFHFYSFTRALTDGKEVLTF